MSESLIRLNWRGIQSKHQNYSKYQNYIVYVWKVSQHLTRCPKDCWDAVIYRGECVEGNRVWEAPIYYASRQSARKAAEGALNDIMRPTLNNTVALLKRQTPAQFKEVIEGRKEPYVSPEMKWWTTVKVLPNAVWKGDSSDHWVQFGGDPDWQLFWLTRDTSQKVERTKLRCRSMVDRTCHFREVLVTDANLVDNIKGHVRRWIPQLRTAEQKIIKKMSGMLEDPDYSHHRDAIERIAAQLRESNKNLKSLATASHQFNKPIMPKR